MSDAKPVEATDKKKAAVKLRKALLRLGIKLVSICVILVLLWCFVGEIYILHNNNMYPHVKDGALLVTYKIGEPIKGDAILYEQDGRMHVARVVGTAGDVVMIDGSGNITVNGLQPAEYVFYPTYSTEDGVEFPLTVEPGTCFVLNDFRESCEDSRMFGCVPIYEMHGKIVLMIQHRDI